MKEITLSRKTVGKLEKFVEEMLDYYNVPGEYFGNIVLANLLTAEMLLGAADENDQLRITVRQDVQGLCFGHKLKSKSLGEKKFDEISLAREQHEIQKDVFIIRSLADAVRVKAMGKSVDLIFSVNGIDLERFMNRSLLVNQYLGSNSTHIA